MWNFLNNGNLRKLLARVFNVTTGHDHDGVNSKAVTVGTPADNSVTTAKIADDQITLAKMKTEAKTHIATFQVEDLAAGADIANRVLLSAPAGRQLTLIAAGIIPFGNSAGVDNANTSVIDLTDGTNTIVSKTYNTGTQPPAAGILGDLGALHATYKVLSAAEKLYLNVTNGATADLTAMMVQVVYQID